MKTVFKSLCEHDIECVLEKEDLLLVSVNKKVYRVREFSPHHYFVINKDDMKFFIRTDDVIIYFFTLARLIPDWDGSVFGE